jgi:citrate/tricarballylate utilization protein
MHATERQTAMHTTAPHATAALAEADSLMVVCNSCRYCEGLCAVFPAMEMRRVFHDRDLNYLANLCHNCGACYSDCQFSPPHEFAVNVPRAFARVRADSYEVYVWPRAFAVLLIRNGLLISGLAALAVALFVIGFVAFHDPAVLFVSAKGAGAFYRLMPHRAMVLLFGAVFLYDVLAIVMSARAFAHDIAEEAARVGSKPVRQALKDTFRLRYLDGGKAGCVNDDDRPTDRRKLYHHATFYGFLLCFASTCVATLYHYLLGREAPYAWYELPVLLGTAGGLGLMVGTAGLSVARLRRDPILVDERRLGMDAAFLVMLFLTGATGIALLLLRSTPAMGITLAIHLGIVFAFFLSIPYSKFVHGLYRFIALMKYAAESAKGGP